MSGIYFRAAWDINKNLIFATVSKMLSKESVQAILHIEVD